MKTFEGKVISDKMNKAAVVEVKFVKKHPLYHKRIVIKRKIHAQNIIGAKLGDKVKMVECRPISKTVAFKITEVIK
jgi:small subunit ribosomal protein S17